MISSFFSRKKVATFLRHRRGVMGFSLVEVTLALGIVSFSVLTLVGMIPLGLTTFHKAAAASVGSQIVQQVVTDVQQTDFDKLTSGTSTVNQLALRYFDDQGNELKNATDPGVVYNVNVVANTSVVLTGGDATAPANLACLAIEIVSNPGQATLTYDSSTKSVTQDVSHGIYVSRYSAFVAKSQ